jgi:LPS export ABC transporter protein LptC
MSPRRIAKALAMAGSVALAAILIFTVIVVRHRRPDEKILQPAGMRPDSMAHERNFHWTELKGAQNEWVLKAVNANYSIDKTGIRLDNANLQMVAKDGKELTLTAPHAEIKLDGEHVRQAEMSGGVVVHYGDFVLTTNSAIFTPDSDQLTASGLVTIVGGGLTVKGIGLTGHPKTEEFQLLKQVSTEIMPAKKNAHAKVS